MEVDGELIRQAARLLAFGLQPSRRTGSDPEYVALLKSYGTDPRFERVTRDIASGLGIRLIDVSQFGVTLGAADDSPFGLTTVAEYRQNLSAEERLLHGLVHVGLAAWLFPRPEMLDDDAAVQQVTALELDAFLREACEKLKAQASGEADPPVDASELERAWRIYLRWPSTRENADKRRAGKNTLALINQAGERLVDFGMFRRTSDDGGGTWQAMQRYRVQVRELAAHEGLRALRALRGG